MGLEPLCLHPDYSTTRRLVIIAPALPSDRQSKLPVSLGLPDSAQRQGEGGLRLQGYFKAAREGEPLVTIITIAFNAVTELEATLQSVFSQTYNNLEYIVIDGGSQDGTVEILQRYNDRLDYWVSEPDQGIASAMNKGLTLATGTLFNHLHSGDRLASPEIVAQIVASYQQEQWRWCFGSQRLRSPAGAIAGYHCPPSFNRRLFNFVNIITHQTVFAERSLVEAVGGFDGRYRCAMDYHLWLRFVQQAEPRQFDWVITEFLLGGRSTDMALAMKEEFLARREVLKQNFFEQFLSLFVVTVRYLKRQLKITTFVRSTVPEKRVDSP